MRFSLLNALDLWIHDQVHDIDVQYIASLGVEGKDIAGAEVAFLTPTRVLAQCCNRAVALAKGVFGGRQVKSYFATWCVLNCYTITHLEAAAACADAT